MFSGDRPKIQDFPWGQNRARLRRKFSLLRGCTPAAAGIFLGFFNPFYTENPSLECILGRVFGVKEGPKSPKIAACGGRILLSTFHSDLWKRYPNIHFFARARLFVTKNGDGRIFFNFGWPYSRPLLRCMTLGTLGIQHPTPDQSMSPSGIRLYWDLISNVGKKRRSTRKRTCRAQNALKTS